MKSLIHTYTVNIEPADADEGGFWAQVPALPGCFSQGETYDETLSNIQEAIQAYVESLIKRGEPIPEESRHPAVIGIQVAIPQSV
jgi:antitoxin HicB